MNTEGESGSGLARMNHWLVWVAAAVGAVLLYASFTNN
jgi:hypothetical protein